MRGNDLDDDDATLSKAGKVLSSEGQNEAQAYVTAQLRDTLRPTIEMEPVQLTDPRHARTMPSIRPANDASPLAKAAASSRPPLPEKAAVGSEPPTLDASTGAPVPRALAEAVRSAGPAIPAPPPLPAFPLIPVRDEVTADCHTLPTSKRGAPPPVTPAPTTTAAAPAPAPSPAQRGRSLAVGALVLLGLLGAAVFLALGLRGGAAPGPAYLGSRDGAHRPAPGRAARAAPLCPSLPRQQPPRRSHLRVARRHRPARGAPPRDGARRTRRPGGASGEARGEAGRAARRPRGPAGGVVAPGFGVEN